MCGYSVTLSNLSVCSDCPSDINLNVMNKLPVRLLRYRDQFLWYALSRKSIHHTSVVRMADKVDKSDLKNRLTPMQYHVTQEKGTERPFTGCYNKTYDAGTYICIVCEQSLFSSETKYDSGCGWPAFNDVLDQGKIKLTPDTSGVGANLLLLISQPGRIRTEVTCAQCGSHLGHVFNDGPLPTRKRFCINSASLNFIPAKNEAGDN